MPPYKNFLKKNFYF